ncbi:uncharacterized protein LOC115985690 [Quercus lobata]|uniref:uncharacterized protein LOC115985690 n=1 Tax=Quercus lobata TaxID=97700 RepID=UPI00124462E3|nr:uncharacterized protein LOC115985690 [Quercus lobata]
MSCLAWNCRGLGNLRTGRELVDIIRAKDPSVVFLAETLTDDARLELVQRNIDFDHRWVVPREGRSRGLALFWKSTVNLKVESSHRYFIDATIDKGTEGEWRLTGFYGEPETTRRWDAWDKLRQLNSHPGVPWLCLGDFNEITKQEEKVGGAIRPHNQMQLFRDVIDECSFMDLGYVGLNFTWSKHFANGNSIWERLDRGLATNGWFLKFPGSKVYHLQCDSSDHRPLLVFFAPLDLPQRKRPFRFEEMWLSNSGCGETVQAAWNNSSGAEGNREILTKIEKCGKDLDWWNRNVFGNVQQELVKKKKLLLQAENEAMISGINTRVRELNS